MKAYRIASLAVILAMLLSSLLVASAGAAPELQTGGTRVIAAGGTAQFRASPPGNDGVQWPEFLGAGESGTPPQPYAGSIVNRSLSNGKAGKGASAKSSSKAKSNPQLNLSFQGLNSRQQRLASGGNQFSLEPPDQGLCAGNGFVLETINDVMRVFNTAGNPLTSPTALNAFYGYAPAINRTTLKYGPFVTDPSCLFDADTQRWFHIVLTLDVDATSGAFLGTNHLDVAVSHTSDPTGAWTIYRLPVQDNGTSGTPDHGCSGGFCLGDYPHLGADANGFYISTNEYSFFGPEYKWAIVYAFSKRQLAANASTVRVTELDTTGALAAAGHPGFTVWPAVSPASQFRGDNDGTEFFMSSDAAEEASGVSGGTTSTRIFVWQLTNTASLDTSSPSLALSNRSVTVGTYVNPPLADQKPGDWPLGQCLIDTACATFLNGEPDPYAETFGKVDTVDSRMMQVTYANGRLWSGLNTTVTVGGANKAGIEWFIVNPGSANIVKSGYLALANNNVIFPAIGVTPSGRGVMAFTLVGADYYPSAGYASIDAVAGVGDIHVAAAGVGPQDGFSEYNYYGPVPGHKRPRWGDYGAAAVDGNAVWIASEYIGQTCTLAQYQASPFGSCGGTRTALMNWDTRVSKLTP